MVITQRVRASIAVIGRLAAKTGRAPLTTGFFSKSTGLSVSYLEILCAQLRRSGLIDSVRGPGGGYVLGRPAEEISVLEIAQAVDPVAVVGSQIAEGATADSEEATPVNALFERASTEMRADLALV
jgi:Rrf2 family protein